MTAPAAPLEKAVELCECLEFCNGNSRRTPCPCDCHAAPADTLVAREKVRESIVVSRKAVNKWIADDRRVPKADIVGHLVLLADVAETLLAALDADKRLEKAETALREIADGAGFSYASQGAAIRMVDIARRYFAEKGER